ncbi:(2Fe-2S)-binding protein [Ketobacter sp. MCCC 1A13808]|uniref:(2Fe-2S)-binding protein n=1 Tax=Ketobacter sp. MCCC 1A13808 TaxID=2602738 RepID=UPI000F1DC0CF|nr:(2Fe-2S)-binding protein [Ketobacter sp. MCCC 1A13808]MVF13027.1 (2Fe-2S)-binding protein [Ketobacter sp. MCCC 1A13808]RLP53893.1 MAG: (2Fe-2S)-binding protein [Ketobacter sp.]
MTAIKFTVNGQPKSLDIDPSTPLLWTLRDHLSMTGTKFGCGVGMCGACTVHFNGAAVRSCQIPVQAVSDAEITTIEGLSESGDHILQTLWVELNVPQCGYCQAGVLMAAAELLKRIPDPTDEEIDAQLSNICRCGTYPRIRAAIHRAAQETKA